MKAQRESDVLKVIKQYLELQGHMVLRLNSGCVITGGRKIKLAEPGTSDLLLCNPTGADAFFEVKAEGGRLRESQISFGNFVRRKGHIYAVVRSIEDVKRVLEALDF